MQEQLFDSVDINFNSTHVPNGLADDIQAECEAYEQSILDAGGIDLQILGIGSDGHIGFNEPLFIIEFENSHEDFNWGNH